ncbi:MAG: ATP-binding cassette domain-containing protein [Deltaproteobacteria bacterium]|nr:ATP-binding cassette domain-containing protein [Deltaproteobacteria bacterium]
MSEILLEASNLIKHFPVTRGLIFSKQVGAVKAVDGISFTIKKGETFGLVGESGCGKTTTSKLILLLEKITSGTILFEGKEIGQLSGPDLKKYRGKVQAVFQDPFSSLSPRRRVGKLIAEPIVVNNKLPRATVRDRVTEVLEVVGLRSDQASLYPHEFSGGQRQRIAVARALALNPSLIILDEPVSALDVSIRAQIMNLLRQIQHQFGLTYLLIAHDLAVVKHMSNRVGVMYLGKLVETAESKELYRNPLHPYTYALYSAALPSHPDFQQEEIILPGEVPSPLNPPPGCRFHPRCFKAKPLCAEEEPMLKDVGAGHEVACHFSLHTE